MATGVPPTSQAASIPSLLPVSREGLSGALLEGNLQQVKAYVEGGGDVNAIFHNSTPLMELALLCNKEQGLPIAEYLIQKGARVNEKNQWGQTALYSAAQVGRDWLVSLLLQKGVSVNEIDVQNRTALFVACKDWTHPKRQTEVARLLLLAEADANIQSKAETGPWTCLAQAIVGGNLDLVQILLQGGADPNLLTSPNIIPGSPVILGQVTAAWFALEYNRLEALPFLAAAGATFGPEATKKKSGDEVGGFYEEDLTQGVPISQLIGQSAVQLVEKLKWSFEERKESPDPNQKA